MAHFSQVSEDSILDSRGRELERSGRWRLSEPQIWLVDWLAEREFDSRCEYIFCPPRKWRFDVAVPSPVVRGRTQAGWAFEIEGGAWNHGRHTRGKGFIADMMKYNTAASLGWKVFRWTPQQVLRGEAAKWIEENLL